MNTTALRRWPRTPTARRAARTQIAARGLTDDEARAINGAAGWSLSAPDGTTVVYRWTRGEWASLAAALPAARGSIVGALSTKK